MENSVQAGLRRSLRHLLQMLAGWTPGKLLLAPHRVGHLRHPSTSPFRCRTSHGLSQLPLGCALQWKTLRSTFAMARSVVTFSDPTCAFCSSFPPMSAFLLSPFDEPVWFEGVSRAQLQNVAKTFLSYLWAMHCNGHHHPGPLRWPGMFILRMEVKFINAFFMPVNDTTRHRLLEASLLAADVQKFTRKSVVLCMHAGHSSARPQRRRQIDDHGHADGHARTNKWLSDGRRL